MHLVTQLLKIGEFCDIFIFLNSVKIHICDVGNSQLEHDLPTPVNDRVISPFFEVFFFAKLCE